MFRLPSAVVTRLREASHGQIDNIIMVKELFERWEILFHRISIPLINDLIYAAVPRFVEVRDLLAPPLVGETVTCDPDFLRRELDTAFLGFDLSVEGVTIYWLDQSKTQ